MRRKVQETTHFCSFAPNTIRIHSLLLGALSLFRGKGGSRSEIAHTRGRKPHFPRNRRIAKWTRNSYGFVISAVAPRGRESARMHTFLDAKVCRFSFPRPPCGPKSEECTLSHPKKCVHLTFCVPSRRPEIQRNPTSSRLEMDFSDFRKSVVFALACARFRMPREGELGRSTCTGQSAKREARGPERRRVGGSPSGIAGVPLWKLENDGFPSLARGCQL